MGEEGLGRCEVWPQGKNALVQGVLGTQSWVTFLFDELSCGYTTSWEELQEAQEQMEDAREPESGDERT